MPEETPQPNPSVFPWLYTKGKSTDAEGGPAEVTLKTKEENSEEIIKILKEVLKIQAKQLHWVRMTGLIVWIVFISALLFGVKIYG